MIDSRLEQMLEHSGSLSISYNEREGFTRISEILLNRCGENELTRTLLLNSIEHISSLEVPMKVHMNYDHLWPVLEKTFEVITDMRTDDSQEGKIFEGVLLEGSKQGWGCLTTILDEMEADKESLLSFNHLNPDTVMNIEWLHHLAGHDDIDKSTVAKQFEIYRQARELIAAGTACAIFDKNFKGSLDDVVLDHPEQGMMSTMRMAAINLPLEEGAQKLKTIKYNLEVAKLVSKVHPKFRAILIDELTRKNDMNRLSHHKFKLLEQGDYIVDTINKSEDALLTEDESWRVKTIRYFIGFAEGGEGSVNDAQYKIFFNTLSDVNSEGAKVISEFMQSDLMKKLRDEDGRADFLFDYMALVIQSLNSVGARPDVLPEGTETAVHKLSKGFLKFDPAGFAEKMLQSYIGQMAILKTRDDKDVRCRELQENYALLFDSLQDRPALLSFLNYRSELRDINNLAKMVRKGFSDLDILNVFFYAYDNTKADKNGLEYFSPSYLLDNCESAAEVIQCSRVTAKDYTIKRLLGSGADGTVFLAADKESRRDVCIKTKSIRSDEANIMKLLEGDDLDHVVKIHHSGVGIASRIVPAEPIEVQKGQSLVFVGKTFEYVARSLVAIVMEYVPGNDLSDILERGELSVDDALRYSVQIFKGLMSLQKKGIFHRDIRPKNIRVDDKGTVKIIDFSNATTDPVAKPRHNDRTGGLIEGVPKGMKMTDYFSLGLILYEMVTGEHLIIGRTDDKGSYTQKAIARDLKKEMFEPDGKLKKFYEERMADLPEELQSIVSACLYNMPSEEIREHYIVARQELRYHFMEKSELIDRIRALEKDE